MAWSGQGSPGLPGRVHSWPPWQLQGWVGGRILKGISTVNFVKHGFHLISAALQDKDKELNDKAILAIEEVEGRLFAEGFGLQLGDDHVQEMRSGHAF